MSKLTELSNEELEELIKDYSERDKEATRILNRFLKDQDFIFDLVREVPVAPSVFVASLHLILKIHAKVLEDKGFTLENVLERMDKERGVREDMKDAQVFNFGIKVEE